MKKVSLVSTLILGTLLLASLTVDAAEPITQTTKGDVTFKTSIDETDNNGGNPVNPGEDGTDPVNPGEDGNSTNGTLRFEWISDFHFGDQKISSGNQKYPAIWNKVTLGADETVRPDATYAPFVQVTDETGDPNKTWELKVKMLDRGKFQYKDGEDQQVLENTYIEIYNVQRTNTVYKGENLAKALANPGVEVYGTAKTIDNAGVVLAQTFKKGSTNGTRSNVIFAGETDYDRVTGEMKPEAQEVNNALKLNTPSSDIKIKDKKYTATLTWELNDVI